MPAPFIATRNALQNSIQTQNLATSHRELLPVGWIEIVGVHKRYTHFTIMKLIAILELLVLASARNSRFAVPSRRVSLQQRRTFVLQTRGGQGYYYDDNSDDGIDPYRSQDPQQYNDDYYYNDQVDDFPRADRPGRRSSFSMPTVIKSGNRKIGVPLLGAGAVFTLMGISLFFNKSLMRLGNLCFVAGVPMTIGPGRMAGYFFQPTKARATGCLILGIFLVFVGWPVLGIILEVFGVLNLFGNMFPVAMAILKTMPVIGPLLSGDSGAKPPSRSSRRDRYYDEPDQRYSNDPYYDRRYDDRNSYYDDDDNRGYY
eukprot:scaffold2271_cov130-Cylindrotheca_fusiformis.AAC.11